MLELENFTEIKTTNESEIIDFEESFFKAFVNIENNRLIRKIWIWDFKNNRLKTKIPYKDINIMTWRDSKNNIKCAVAANLNNEISQFSEFGFKPPQDKAINYAEILTIFTGELNRTNGIRLDRFFLRGCCIPFMFDKGYHGLFSTCAIKPLETYKRWGWIVIDEAILDNEKRYFLYYDILKNYVQKNEPEN